MARRLRYGTKARGLVRTPGLMRQEDDRLTAPREASFTQTYRMQAFLHKLLPLAYTT